MNMVDLAEAIVEDGKRWAEERAREESFEALVIVTAEEILTAAEMDEILYAIDPQTAALMEATERIGGSVLPETEE